MTANTCAPRGLKWKHANLQRLEDTRPIHEGRVKGFATLTQHAGLTPGIKSWRRVYSVEALMTRRPGRGHFQVMTLRLKGLLSGTTAGFIRE